jgi:ABC-type multidrug transport system ATPase subunit
VKGSIGEDRVELRIEFQVIGVEQPGINTTLFRSRDHAARSVNSDNLCSGGYKLFREYAVAAAEIENALSRLRVEKIEYRLAQIGDKTRVFGVTRGTPFLRRSLRSLWHTSMLIGQPGKVTARPIHPRRETADLHSGAIKNLRFLMADSHINQAVVVEGLVKQFGPFAALRGVSGEFASGRLFVVLGENGAGKTTLLRIIAGLSQPTRGAVSVLGSRNIKDVRAQIGYMAHPSLLYDEMGGMENLRYFAGLYGIGAKGDSEDLAEPRCREVIAAVKLDPDLERPIGQYSQGMRQRMSLARALLNDPRLLLLDEPFSNVDSRSAKQMSDLLAGLRDHGKTIFVVTHQPALLDTVADEFVWMEAGKISNRTPHFQTPQ